MGEIQSVTVVGAGTMGSQIALQSALAGRYQVTLVDAVPGQLQRARANNTRLVDRAVEKGRMTREQADAALSRIKDSGNLEQAAKNADLIIEAVIEDFDTKSKVFSELGKHADRDAIIASNSSTIAISRLADFTKRPDQCCNMHFFYPPLVMDLVEIVRGPSTSDATVERAAEFAKAIGRTPVVLNREIPGFIVNRILHMATQEAYRLLDAGVASVEDIDIAVEKGLRWPLGPFRLGDLTGLDVTYAARKHMYETTGDERYRPSPALEAKVRAGELGRKTGRGWYQYPAGEEKG